MINIRHENSFEALKPFKDQYMQQTTAPLDGMWLCGFVPMADHYGFYVSSDLAGYCCVNAEGYLLQFHLPDAYQSAASDLFRALVNNQCTTRTKIQGAYASTAEPQLLSYCADEFTRFEVNTLMFQFAGTNDNSHQTNDTATLTLIDASQLEQAASFASQHMGAPKEWLAGYFGNLIDRRELFGYWKNGTLLATGECRGYDEYQTEYADLGVIVAIDHRGKGIATLVLKQLTAEAESRGLIPICSTEKTNTGAQKAINRAGFIANHRIIQFCQPANSEPSGIKNSAVTTEK